MTFNNEYLVIRKIKSCNTELHR